MSGSTIGGIVGATIGFFVGGPAGARWGWMLGSIAGGIIDPQQIQGQRLTDAQGQTATEGVMRPIIYGVAACAGNLIQIGPLVEHKHKQQQGKGGPVQISYTYTRTYAIRVCEGPITGILRVWRNDKLIYDATSSGDPIAADSAAIASKMTFYLGDETQMPDPNLEALPTANGGGVGNVCAHRGSAYVVVVDDDLTDMQGAIPQYKWEVRTCVCTDGNGEVSWTDGYTGTAQSVATLAGGADAWLIGGDNGTLARSVDNGANWTLIDFTTQCGWPSTYVANNLVFTGTQWLMTSSGTDTTYATSPTGSTWTPGTSFATGIHPFANKECLIDGVAWAGVPVDGSVTRLMQLEPANRSTTISLGSNGNVSCPSAKLGGVYLVGTVGNILTGASLAGCVPTQAVAGGSDVFGFAYGNSVHLCAVNVGGTYYRSTDGGATWSAITAPALSFRGFAFYGSVFYGTTKDYIYASLDHGLTWAIVDSSFYPNATLSTMTSTPTGMLACTTNGYTAAAVIAGFGSNIMQMPDAPDFGVDLQGNVVGPPSAQLAICSSELSNIVADICDRCGITGSQIDVTALTSTVRGYLIGSQYSGADCIRTLQQGYFFDFPEWDKKLHGVLRGGASQFTIGDDDLLLEDDNDTTTRAQAVEFPRKLNLVTADPTANYATTTQTAARRTEDVRAVGEATIQLPFSLTPSEAVQKADILLKIAWTEAQGRWERHLPEEYSEMTPSDVFTYNGTRYRVQSAALENDETLFKAVRDRQSAYTSVATAPDGVAPTPPVSSMKGPTVFAAMNLPRLRSQDASPGMYIAVQGLLAGWLGCDLQLSVDAGVSFQSVAQIMVASEMGQLTGDIGASTSPIPVEMNVDGQLDSVTTAQLAARANGFAIITGGVSEIGQFQTATPTFGADYDLTGLVRGALGTTAAAHSEGDKFVLLQNVLFLPLDISLAGQTLIFRPVSIGTPAANNVTYSVQFVPQFTGPDTTVFYTDDLGNLYETDVGAYYEETTA